MKKYHWRKIKEKKHGTVLGILVEVENSETKALYWHGGEDINEDTPDYVSAALIELSNLLAAGLVGEIDHLSDNLMLSDVEELETMEEDIRKVSKALFDKHAYYHTPGLEYGTLHAEPFRIKGRIEVRIESCKRERLQVLNKMLRGLFSGSFQLGSFDGSTEEPIKALGIFVFRASVTITDKAFNFGDIYEVLKSTEAKSIMKKIEEGDVILIKVDGVTVNRTFTYMRISKDGYHVLLPEEVKRIL